MRASSSEAEFPLDAYFLEKAINLKIIARVGAGMENMTSLTKLGIKLIRSPEGNKILWQSLVIGTLLVRDESTFISLMKLKRGGLEKENEENFG